MTREEFIQQAALRLITARPDKLMYEIAELAENLANCVYGEEKVKGPVVVSCVTAGEAKLETYNKYYKHKKQ